MCTAYRAINFGHGGDLLACVLHIEPFGHGGDLLACVLHIEPFGHEGILLACVLRIAWLEPLRCQKYAAAALLAQRKYFIIRLIGCVHSLWG